MATAGEIILGLLMVVIAGCLNGSWNASFSPKLGISVGKPGSEGCDLDFHYAWVLFQIYAALMNVPICLYWAGGPERTLWIVSNASTLDLILVVVFSLLWGVGSVLFGLACQIAGVGLGTNLSMGVIMILGTFLPLLLEELVLTPFGGVILVGLIVCCVGLFFSVKSLQTRDMDEVAAMNDTAASDFNRNDNSYHKGDDDDDDDDENDGEKAISTKDETVAADHNKTYSTFQKLVICLLTGIFSSQLQFAFVFGENMIDLAKSQYGPGSTPSSGSAAIIWLFAFSLSCPVSIVYGFYSSPSHVSVSTLWRCPWYRHPLVIATTSIPFIAHIHLYGYTNSILPDDIAASVSWPVLMMVTTTTGLVWSLILGEWKQASSRSRRQLFTGMGIVMTGVGLLMASVAVPQ